MKRQRKHGSASAAIAPDTRKKERDRERTYRRATKRSHISDSVTIDALPENGKVPTSFESDFGAGVEKILRDCERSLREEILAAARNRVKEHDRALLQAFDLVLKNGKERKESIWQIAKSRSAAAAGKTISKTRGNGKRQKSIIGGA